MNKHTVCSFFIDVSFSGQVDCLLLLYSNQKNLYEEEKVYLRYLDKRRLEFMLLGYHKVTFLPGLAFSLQATRALSQVLSFLGSSSSSSSSKWKWKNNDKF